MNTKSTEKQTIDWMITLVPFFLILVLCIFFFCFPDSSNAVLTSIRTFLGDSFSVYYLLIGIGCVVISLYLSFSKYGDIVLGDKGAKPKYSFWAWGSMMFTAGLAADIVFYSFCEWVLYWDDPHTLELGRNMDWASTFTLFHWGPTVWSFYLVLAVAFGFMLHVRKRTRQKYSEACRPILGKYTDGLAGRLIDLLAVFALLLRILYKGSKKKTPYAAGMSAEAAGKAAVDAGMKKVEVFVKGLGSGRENAIRSLQTAGLEITAINDETPIPHNGCRPPKRPRK